MKATENKSSSKAAKPETLAEALERIETMQLAFDTYRVVEEGKVQNLENEVKSQAQDNAALKRQLTLEKGKTKKLGEQLAESQAQLEEMEYPYESRKELTECDKLGEVLVTLLQNYDLDHPVSAFQRTILQSQLVNARKHG